MKRIFKLIGITFIVIMILLISINAFFFLTNTIIYRRYVKYSYSISIQSTETDFIANVPFPLNEDNCYLPDLFNSINTNGYCSYEINQSKYGYSLQIIGNKSAKIDAIYEKEGDINKNMNYKNLSLTDYSKYVELDEELKFGRNTFFYSKDNNISIYFKFEYEDGFHEGIFKMFGGGFGDYTYIGNLSYGWNQYTIDTVEAIA